jgi:hypothetical protein
MAPLPVQIEELSTALAEVIADSGFMVGQVRIERITTMTYTFFITEHGEQESEPYTIEIT